ncbi:MAG: TlpA family protein disulfide reductase [Phycisphaerales bacterium]|nr:MAG: TlpA family protein disulfide reductase [Phycisphaerales bacterium]
MHLINRASIVALCAGLLLGASAAAAPAGLEAVDRANSLMSERIIEARDTGTDSEALRRQIAIEALAESGLEVGEMSAAQIERAGRLLSTAGLSDAGRERLGTLARSDTADGAVAAVALAGMVDGEAPQAERTEAVRKAITHPGLAAALRRGDASNVFFMLGYAPDETLQGVRTEALALAHLFDNDLPPQVIGSGVVFVRAMLRLDAPAQTREHVRTALLVQHERAIGDAATDDERLLGRLKRNVEYLGGAYARGELLGHASPELTITWSSDETIATLADLRGKVVVIDFWATWCGPCIRSFPNLRELTSHYSGYPVVVLGVTSLQGSHVGPDERVDTTGNPDLEYALMSEYLPQREMTWPVVFTSQDVYNPDFGVTGIPHVAILAPDGTVRYNGLHPMDPMEEKTAKIDALLEEFGLPSPAAN